MGIDIRRYRKRPDLYPSEKAGRAYFFVPLPAFPAIYSFSPIFAKLPQRGFSSTLWTVGRLTGIQ
jgi:hypothetical protein